MANYLGHCTNCWGGPAVGKHDDTKRQADGQVPPGEDVPPRRDKGGESKSGDRK